MKLGVKSGTVKQHTYASDVLFSAIGANGRAEHYGYAAEQVEPYWIAVVLLQASICPGPPVRVWPLY